MAAGTPAVFCNYLICKNEYDLELELCSCCECHANLISAEFKLYFQLFMAVSSGRYRPLEIVFNYLCKNNPNSLSSANRHHATALLTQKRLSMTILRLSCFSPEDRMYF